MRNSSYQPKSRYFHHRRMCTHLARSLLAQKDEPGRKHINTTVNDEIIPESRRHIIKLSVNRASYKSRRHLHKNIQSARHLFVSVLPIFNRWCMRGRKKFELPIREPVSSRNTILRVELRDAMRCFTKWYVLIKNARLLNRGISWKEEHEEKAAVTSRMLR